MMDYTGVSLYPMAEPAEKRRLDTAKVDVPAPANNRGSAGFTAASGPNPFSLYQPLQQDASIFRFKEPLAPPRTNLPQSTQAQVTPLGLLPAHLSQMVNANMEKLAGQIMSFFNGHRNAKPTTEEEQRRRQLNDALGVGLLGEVIKVEEAAKGQMPGEEA